MISPGAFNGSFIESSDGSLNGATSFVDCESESVAFNGVASAAARVTQSLVVRRNDVLATIQMDWAGTTYHSRIIAKFKCFCIDARARSVVTTPE